MGQDGMVPLHRWEVDAGSGALRPRPLLADGHAEPDDLAADIVKSLGPPRGMDTIGKRKRDDEEAGAIPMSRRAVDDLFTGMMWHRAR